MTENMLLDEIENIDEENIEEDVDVAEEVLEEKRKTALRRKQAIRKKHRRGELNDLLTDGMVTKPWGKVKKEKEEMSFAARKAKSLAKSDGEEDIET